MPLGGSRETSCFNKAFEGGLMIFLNECFGSSAVWLQQRFGLLLSHISDAQFGESVARVT